MRRRRIIRRATIGLAVATAGMWIFSTLAYLTVAAEAGDDHFILSLHAGLLDAIVAHGGYAGWIQPHIQIGRASRFDTGPMTTERVIARTGATVRISIPLKLSVLVSLAIAVLVIWLTKSKPP